MVDREVNVRLQAHVSQYMSNMQQASARTAAMGSQVQRTMAANQQALRAGGMAAVGFGAALGVGLGSAVSAGAEFEAQMNSVRAVSQANATEFQALSDVAREMGATTKFSATEAAGGLNFLSMAGFEATESVEALPGVLDLAAAGNMDLAQAADISSNVLQGFGMEAENIARVNDTMAATFTSANTNLTQLGNAMSFVAPVANSAGIELEETSAAIGLMSDAGIQGTRAGTSLRMAMSRLLDETGPAADVLDRLGISAFDSSGELRDLDDIIGQLEESGASAGEIIELFGLRAGPAMQTLVDRGSDALSDFTDELEESGGTAKRVADTQMEGLQGAVTELGSAVEGLKIKIAESGGLNESLEDLTDTTTGLVRALESAPDEVVGLATQLAGSTAVVSTFGGALALAASKMGGFSAVAGAAAKGFGGGILFAGATKALGELGDSAESANTKLDDIIETSNSIAEAERRAQQETENMGAELLNSIGPVEQWNRIWSGEFAGIIGMSGDLIEALKLMSHETEIAAGFADRAATGFSNWAAKADPLNVTMAGFPAAVEAASSATDDVGESAGRAATGFAELGSSVDAMAGNAKGALASFGSVGDRVLSAYSENLADAAAANDQATDDMADDWGAYMASLEQTLEDQREWHDNLNRIRDVAGDEYADMLAAQGMEQAGLHAEIADRNAEEIQKAADRELTIRSQAAEEAIAQLHRSGVQIVNSSGELADEAASAIADELGVTPANVRSILAESETVMRAQLESAADAAGAGGHSVVARLAAEFNAGGQTLTDIVNQWASGTVDPLNTVIGQIDGEQVVYDASDWRNVPVGGAFAAGGVRRPEAHIADRPSVLFGEPSTGGEAFIPLSPSGPGSIQRSVELWEETGRRLGVDPEMTMAAGGFTSPGDVPAVPSMPFGGGMADATEGTIQRARDEVVAWLEENLAPELGSGVGYQAMMEALHSQFPGLPLISGPRPGSRTLSGNLSWHARGRAVDVPPERAVAEWIADNYGPETLELITPWRSVDLHHGSPHRYSQAVHEQHSGSGAHIHWAMARGGILPADVFDDGGMLASGAAAINTSGRPEAVVPSDSLANMEAHLAVIADSTSGLRQRIDQWNDLPDEVRHARGIPTDLEQAAREAGSTIFEDLSIGEPTTPKPSQDEQQMREDALQQLVELQREMRENRRQIAFEQMPLEDKIADVSDRMEAEREFTDEWMRLRDERQQLADEMAQRREDALERHMERQREMAANRRELAFEQMDLEAQIADVSDRMDGERKFTDEWMRLHRQREKLVEELQRKHRDAVEEREQLERDLADRRAEFEESVARTRREHQEQVDDAIARRREELAGQVDPLAGVSRISDAGSRTHMEGLFRARDATESINEQAGMLAEWGQAVGDLRERGFDQAMLESIGVARPGEGALRQAELLLDSPRLDELSDAFARLDDRIGEQVDREAGGDTPLGQSLDRMESTLHADLGDLRSSFREDAQGIREDLGSVVSELKGLRAAVEDRPTRSEMRDAVRSGASR